MRTFLLTVLLMSGIVLAEQPPPKKASVQRKVRFNGHLLGPAELGTLERLERGVGRLDEGAYWYDPRSGASGRWGGPTLAFLPPGLTLGGPLPADASGGGQGTLTGVFINGRELHPVDVVGLQQIIGQVWPGRWWVDAQGNYGLEGGPALGNLALLAQANRRGSSGQAWSKRYEGSRPGDTLNMSSDGRTKCFSTPTYSHCSE